MKPIPTFIAISAMLVLSSAASAAERAKADIDCKATGEKLVYDCMIMLMNRKSGDPIPGAKIVVRADMPSMPMAHNVAPVNATGHGQARKLPRPHKALRLHGEWALTLDVSRPLRDRLVTKLQFGEMGAMKHGEGNDAGRRHEAHRGPAQERMMCVPGVAPGGVETRSRGFVRVTSTSAQ